MKTDNLRRSYLEGRINRRDFLAGATALGLSSAMIAGSLPSRAKAAAPNKGGVFRVAPADGATTDTLDPQTYSSTFDILFSYAIRNYLVEIDGDNNLVGELAESWDSSPDARDWSFKIRSGVEFHNGKTLTPEDVIASINVHRSEGSKSPAKSLLETVESISVDGDRVKFSLSTGNADFPYTMFDYHLPIMPSDGAGGVEWQGGVGTGGYVLENFEPGVRASMVRNPNYWKGDRAHFEAAEIVGVNDVTARMNGLVTNGLDAIDQPELKVVDRLSQNPDVAIDEVTSTKHHAFPMDTTVKPFDDPNVRLALKYGIDREAYLRSILRGHGAVGNDHPFGPTMPFYDPSVEQRQYDPERAKHHLKQAGLDSLQVALHAGDIFAGGVDAAVLYQEHAKKAGIDLQVVREPTDGYWSNVWMKKPWTASFWDARPIPDLMLSLAYVSGANWNESRFNNSHFDSLVAEARAELDPEKRQALYSEVQLILRDEGGVIIPVFNNLVSARRNNVGRGEKLSSAYGLDGLKAIERWWFT